MESFGTEDNIYRAEHIARSVDSEMTMLANARRVGRNSIVKALTASTQESMDLAGQEYDSQHPEMRMLAELRKAVSQAEQGYEKPLLLGGVNDQEYFTQYALLASELLGTPELTEEVINVMTSSQDGRPSSRAVTAHTFIEGYDLKLSTELPRLTDNNDRDYFIELARREEGETNRGDESNWNIKFGTGFDEIK